MLKYETKIRLGRKLYTVILDSHLVKDIQRKKAESPVIEHIKEYGTYEFLDDYNNDDCQLIEFRQLTKEEENMASVNMVKSGVIPSPTSLERLNDESSGKRKASLSDDERPTKKNHVSEVDLPLPKIVNGTVLPEQPKNHTGFGNKHQNSFTSGITNISANIAESRKLPSPSSLERLNEESSGKREASMSDDEGPALDEKITVHLFDGLSTHSKSENCAANLSTSLIKDDVNLWDPPLDFSISDDQGYSSDQSELPNYHLLCNKEGNDIDQLLENINLPTNTFDVDDSGNSRSLPVNKDTNTTSSTTSAKDDDAQPRTTVTTDGHRPKNNAGKTMLDYVESGKGSRVSRTQCNIERVKIALNDLKREASIIYFMHRSEKLSTANKNYSVQLCHFVEEMKSEMKELQEISENIKATLQKKNTRQNDQLSDFNENSQIGSDLCHELTATGTSLPNVGGTLNSHSSQESHSSEDNRTNLQAKLTTDSEKVQYRKLNLKNQQRTLSNAKHFCVACNQGFVTEKALRSHYSKHLNYKYKCEKCGKELKSENSMRIHKKCHEQGSGFICGICRKEFDLKWNFQKHLQAHTDERFQCPHANCSKLYKYKSSMENHYRDFHRANQEKTIQCTDCDKLYLTRNGMHSHRAKIHRNPKKEKIS